MKKQLFSLVMMLALVIVAGSAMAQTNVTPYPGGTYSYTLSGIKTNPAGTAANAITGANATIKNVENSGVDYTGTNIATPAATDFTLNFDITYGLLATGTRTVTVTVTDGAASGSCSNFIELEVIINPLPTLALSIAASEDQYCQNKKSSPLNDNEAASVGATTNSFTFTVSPTITNDPDVYTYSYAITMPAAQGLATYDIAYAGPGTWNEGAGTVTGATSETDGVFTVTFTTTTGLAPIDLTATITGTPTLTATNGGATYNGTITTASDAVSVKTMPSIGTFN